MDRNKIIRKASLISIFGNAVLAILKIFIGIVSGSLAVLGDGIDSLTDVFVSLITLVTSIIIARPPDKEHPYGHYRAETIATSILAFVMFFIGGQLSLSTAEKLYGHDATAMPEMIAVYVTILSIGGKLALAWSQYFLGKKSDSSILIANGKNMVNDVVTSVGVLVGLGCAFYFNMPSVDKWIAILIGIWIMFSAVRIFLGTINEFMEGVNDEELYEKLFEAVGKIEGVSNPHRVRIKKLGIYCNVEMDVEVNGNLKVTDAHQLIGQTEKAIRTSLPNVYDIVIHFEPVGNIEHEERFGLTDS